MINQYRYKPTVSSTQMTDI